MDRKILKDRQIDLKRLRDGNRLDKCIVYYNY